MSIQQGLKIAVVILIVLVIGFGSFVYGINIGHTQKLQALRISELFGETDKRIPDADFKLLLDAWYLIDEKYVFPDSPNSEERLWGSISGLIDSIGDPYSQFLPPSEAKTFEEDIRGNFGGVGVEIGMRDDILTVISPLMGTPAYKAGIQAGDRIVEIDGVTTQSVSIDEAVNKIRGPVGKEVVLTVFRESTNERIEIPIVRGIIHVPTIDTEIKDGVFVLSLYNFTGQSTQLFINALVEFENSNTNKLVIDLRNNPGGFLNAAINIASLFLAEGTPIVIEDLGEDTDEKIHRSLGTELLSKSPEMVVLVNEGSASASEILAAALSDNRLAVLVGEKTFGKGSVQELVPLTDETYIKITVARWLTPNRHSLSEDGISPKIEVVLTAEDIARELDPQLEKAIEILNK